MTSLPWLFFNRRIKPYALAVSLACLVIAIGSLVLRNLVGSTFDDLNPAGVFVGGLSLSSFLLLMYGWWAQKNRPMEVGLLASSGVFGTLASYVFLENGLLAVSGWISVAWVVASVGAYMLEVTQDE